MSDDSVSAALRSSHRLVVVEASAGCGKTHQGATYAADVSLQLSGGGRVLILAHTHAACDVFIRRTPQLRNRVEVRTIYSLIFDIAAAYHRALDLPPKPAIWARSEKKGFEEVGARVARLLEAAPAIERMLARRYPVVICDEHQDTNSDQHAVAMAFHRGGSALRIFGDPMQRIYAETRKKSEIDKDDARWEAMKSQADLYEVLDQPHRWSSAIPLGNWILEARAKLHDGGAIDLTGALPESVCVVRADNTSPTIKQYILSKADRAPISAIERTSKSLLVLCPQNATVQAMSAFFYRRLPIWEGHVRDALTQLVSTVQRAKGNPSAIADAALGFITTVCTGFAPSAFGKTLLEEVKNGCTSKRTKLPATLQSLALHLVTYPDHHGIANVLHALRHCIKTDDAFSKVKVDLLREYGDAIALGDFSDPDEGLAEIARRRTVSRPMPPAKAISTIHKAKGLERTDVLIMPCDAKHFPDNIAGRRRLYVAMSRASSRLTLVVPRSNPSPLLHV